MSPPSSTYPLSYSNLILRSPFLHPSLSPSSYLSLCLSLALLILRQWSMTPPVTKSSSVIIRCWCLLCLRQSLSCHHNVFHPASYWFYPQRRVSCWPAIIHVICLEEHFSESWDWFHVTFFVAWLLPQEIQIFHVTYSFWLCFFVKNQTHQMELQWYRYEYVSIVRDISTSVSTQWVVWFYLHSYPTYSSPW